MASIVPKPAPHEQTTDALLLLTLPPPQSLKAALVPILSNTSRHNLDIIVKLPYDDSSHSRRASFYWAERIIRELYQLTTSIEEEVDVTVFLYGGKKRVGIVLDKHGVVRIGKRRRWREIFVFGNTDSDGILDGLKGSGGTAQFIYFSAESESEIEDVDSKQEPWWQEGSSSRPSSARDDHSISCVGGTFDYLHSGHKLLLTLTAYLIPSSPSLLYQETKIIIGLTGSELLKNKKYGEYLTSWDVRCEGCIYFLYKIFGEGSSSVSDADNTKSSVDLPTTTRINTYTLTLTLQTDDTSSHTDSSTLPSIALEIHEIQDPFGPTITMEEVSCLVVSEETKSGGWMINDRRKEKGWEELEVFVVGLIGEGEGSEKISSTEMRKRAAEKAGK